MPFFHEKSRTHNPCCFLFFFLGSKLVSCIGVTCPAVVKALRVELVTGQPLAKCAQQAAVICNPTEDSHFQQYPKLSICSMDWKGVLDVGAWRSKRTLFRACMHTVCMSAQIQTQFGDWSFCLFQSSLWEAFPFSLPQCCSER